MKPLDPRLWRRSAATRGLLVGSVAVGSALGSAIIVQATVIMPVAVIGEALLSFLGLGIQPPTASLGIMLSDAQQYLAKAPFAAVVPGLAIAVICLGFNLFGDALRDALDPTASDRK